MILIKQETKSELKLVPTCANAESAEKTNLLEITFPLFVHIVKPFESYYMPILFLSSENTVGTKVRLSISHMEKSNEGERR